MRDSGNTRRDTSYPVEDRSPHHPNVHDYRREGTRFQPTAFTQVETEVQRWVRQGWGEDLSWVGIFMRPPGEPKEPPEWKAASASCVLA